MNKEEYRQVEAIVNGRVEAAHLALNSLLFMQKQLQIEIDRASAELSKARAAFESVQSWGEKR
jgi:hypothetical protein